MDIGTKIREARAAAHLTQEQAAEALGVSRQTISNWENNRTYPDIVSVIRMSDLYSVSLDRLLKEEENMPMPDYIDYLEKSTNTVRSKERLSKIILVSVYLAVWAFALIAFWAFTDPGDSLGFSVVFLMIALPVTTFAISVMIGKNDMWGRFKWFSAAAFGVMYMFAWYATFSAANMIFNEYSVGIRMPDPVMLVAGATVSVIGLGIGCAVRRAAARRRK